MNLNFISNAKGIASGRGVVAFISKLIPYTSDSGSLDAVVVAAEGVQVDPRLDRRKLPEIYMFVCGEKKQMLKHEHKSQLFFFQRHM